MGRFNCIVKVSSDGYADVVRNGNSLRVFYTERFVIGLRHDVTLGDGLPWTPIVIEVNGGRTEAFSRYRDLLSQLMFIPPSGSMFANVSNTRSMHNTFDYKDADTLKKIIIDHCKKWYSLEVMSF